MATVAELRAAVVQEAQSWIGTPFHVNAALKGIGADCGRWIAAVYRTVGILHFEQTEHWPGDWFFHAKDEKYLDLVASLMTPVADPMPGDTALFRVGPLFAHAALVVEWPMVLHVWRVREKIQLTRADEWPLKGREVKCFSPFAL